MIQIKLNVDKDMILINFELRYNKIKIQNDFEPIWWKMKNEIHISFEVKFEVPFVFEKRYVQYKRVELSSRLKKMNQSYVFLLISVASRLQKWTEMIWVSKACAQLSLCSWIRCWLLSIVKYGK